MAETIGKLIRFNQKTVTVLTQDGRQHREYLQSDVSPADGFSLFNLYANRETVAAKPTVTPLLDGASPLPGQAMMKVGLSRPYSTQSLPKGPRLLMLRAPRAAS